MSSFNVGIADWIYTKDMRVLVKSHLPISVEKAWSLVKRSETLRFVTRGLMGFGSADFPEVWQERQVISTRLRAFGLIPLWMHTLRFERIDHVKMELATTEQGGLVSTWNHLIKVEAASTNSCTYSDQIEIKAGVLTLFVWLFAQFFYRYRQSRWRLMIGQVK